MNTEPTPPSVPHPLGPMEGQSTVLNVVEHLLKHPASLLHACGHGGWKVILLLLTITAFSLGIFGLLLGTFSGGVQLWAAPLKVGLGTIAAMLICLPSLYIFSALGGLQARLVQIAGVLLSMVALVGLLLLGFAPVLWVFSSSTASIGFMGFLAIAFWLIALFFGARLLLSLSAILGLQNRNYLVLWIGIFLVVTLQMSTSLRPIIGTAETLFPSEKRFFLEQWLVSFEPSDAATTK